MLSLQEVKECKNQEGLKELLHCKNQSFDRYYLTYVHDTMLNVHDCNPMKHVNWIIKNNYDHPVLLI